MEQSLIFKLNDFLLRNSVDEEIFYGTVNVFHCIQVTLSNPEFALHRHLINVGGDKKCSKSKSAQYILMQQYLNVQNTSIQHSKRRALISYNILKYGTDKT